MFKLYHFHISWNLIKINMNSVNIISISRPLNTLYAHNMELLCRLCMVKCQLLFICILVKTFTDS